MGLYSDVFDRTTIYNLFFFNIKTATEKASYYELDDKVKLLWNSLSDKQYSGISYDTTYKNHGVYYPEFSKIVVLCYGYVSVGEDGNLKRELKQVINPSESIMIEMFFDVLSNLHTYNNTNKTNAKNILCGHNILDYDIPFLLKRYVINKLKGNIINNNNIPDQLKKTLDSKPWESSTIIDTASVWKFGSYGGKVPMETISEILGFKKSVDLMSMEDISKYYWNNINTAPQETIKNIGLQCANTVNCVIKMLDELRKM